VANSPTPIRSFREYPCVVNTSSASSAGAAVVEAFRRGRFCHQPRRRLNKFDLFVVVDDDVVVVVFVVGADDEDDEDEEEVDAASALIVAHTEKKKQL
jgi:hypothetical protein